MNKHIDVKHYFIKDYVVQVDIVLNHVDSKANKAKILQFFT